MKAETMAEILGAAIEAAIAPLVVRIAALETTIAALEARPVSASNGGNFDLADLLPEGDFDPETRTRTLYFQRGEERASVRFKDVGVPLHRGVYQAGITYEQGDVLTHNGSFWIALCATSSRPADFGDGARAWQLAVKHGRDGKDRHDGS